MNFEISSSHFSSVSADQQWAEASSSAHRSSVIRSHTHSLHFFPAASEQDWPREIVGLLVFEWFVVSSFLILKMLNWGSSSVQVGELLLLLQSLIFVREGTVMRETTTKCWHCCAETQYVHRGVVVVWWCGTTWWRCCSIFSLSGSSGL